MNFNLLFETLASLGGKKGKNCVEFISPDLVIKEKESGVKYTVTHVLKDKNTNQPVVKAYRYYGPGSNKKYFIYISPKYFNKYDKV